MYTFRHTYIVSEHNERLELIFFHTYYVFLTIALPLACYFGWWNLRARMEDICKQILCFKFLQAYFTCTFTLYGKKYVDTWPSYPYVVVTASSLLGKLSTKL